MSLLHYLTSDEWNKKSFYGKKLQIFYQCILNGICNLYLHNWIIALDSESLGNMKKRQTEIGTLHRQLIFESIFAAQNVFVVLFAYFRVSDLPYQVILFIIISQIMAVLLKIWYYANNHVWRNTFTKEEISLNFQRFKKNMKVNAKGLGNKAQVYDFFIDMIILINLH